MNKTNSLVIRFLKEAVSGPAVDALLAEFPTISDLMNASESDIIKLKGMDASAAKRLRAILEFAKVVHQPVDTMHAMHSPQDVYTWVREDMEFLQVEHFAVIGLSTKNHVLCTETVSIGTLNASIVHPRETFRILIKRACAQCILVHNHPSGDPAPSQEDISITKTLVEVGKLLDIPVLDHVVVGRGKYVSLKQAMMI